MKNSLKKDFNRRLAWHNNRSSAVFPIFSSKKTKFYIVFQNYWRWKNNFKNIFVILRIRDVNGETISRSNIKIKDHNEILVNDFFDNTNFSEGTAEIEIFSESNLGFPFPAILAFYKTGKEISVVHSAGRLLNSNEKFDVNYWKESNFLVNFSDFFSPFVSLFFGQLVPKSSVFKFSVVNFENNKTILKKSIQFSALPFGAKTFYLKKYLLKKDLKKIKSKKVFIIFETNIEGVFGRFVVGNFHSKSSHHFVTHSFQYINHEDEDSIGSEKGKISTFLTIFNQRPLKVCATSYPTNAKSKLNLKTYCGKFDEVLQKKEEKISLITGGIEAKGFNYSISEDKIVKLVSIQNSPSRINVNYNFSLKNSTHPSDLATGFKSRIYPPKKSFWGSGVALNNFETKLFFRNMSHNPKKTNKIKCKILIWNSNKKISKSLTIKPESCKVIDLSFFNEKDSFFSWKVIADESNLDVFWVSYNKKSGALCAEHSF